MGSRTPSAMCVLNRRGKTLHEATYFSLNNDSNKIAHQRWLLVCSEIFERDRSGLNVHVSTSSIISQFEFTLRSTGRLTDQARTVDDKFQLTQKIENQTYLSDTK